MKDKIIEILKEELAGNYLVSDETYEKIASRIEISEELIEKAEAYKIIKMRDAFVEKDFDEVWHWLYQVVSPNFEKHSDEAWAELEQLATEYAAGLKEGGK